MVRKMMFSCATPSASSRSMAFAAVAHKAHPTPVLTKPPGFGKPTLPHSAFKKEIGNHLFFPPGQSLTTLRVCRPNQKEFLSTIGIKGGVFGAKKMENFSVPSAPWIWSTPSPGELFAGAWSHFPQVVPRCVGNVVEAHLDFLQLLGDPIPTQPVAAADLDRPRPPSPHQTAEPLDFGVAIMCCLTHAASRNFWPATRPLAGGRHAQCMTFPSLQSFIFMAAWVQRPPI